MHFKICIELNLQSSLVCHHGLSQGIARGWSWGAYDPPSPLWELCYVPIIQMAKTCEFEESTCNKSFPVLDSYLLQLQDLTSAVDQCSFRNQNRVIYAMWNQKLIDISGWTTPYEFLLELDN